MIVLELEVVLIYCKYLFVNKWVGNSKVNLDFFFVGIKYFVLDVGGKFFNIFLIVYFDGFFLFFDNDLIWIEKRYILLLCLN